MTDDGVDMELVKVRAALFIKYSTTIAWTTLLTVAALPMIFDIYLVSMTTAMWMGNAAVIFYIGSIFNDPYQTAENVLDV